MFEEQHGRIVPGATISEEIGARRGRSGTVCAQRTGRDPSTESPGTILLIPALHFPSGGNSPVRVSCRWSCLWRSRGIIPAIFQKSRVSKWCLSHKRFISKLTSEHLWVPQAVPAPVRRSTRSVANRMGERPARPEAKGTCALPVLEGMPLRPPGSYWKNME